MTDRKKDRNERTEDTNTYRTYIKKDINNITGKSGKEEEKHGMSIPIFQQSC